MRVTLFVPCFVDLAWPGAAVGVFRVIEKLGHTVDFPEDLACCGQPPFNAGYWDQARAVAARVLRRLSDAEAVVVPSGSCATMIKASYPTLFAGMAQEAAAVELSKRCWEFSDFLVNGLGVSDVGARFPHTVTFHDGCHGLRELGAAEPPRRLLSHVHGLRLVEMEDVGTCCGFGGVFAVKHAPISAAMGRARCDAAVETEAEYVVSNDPSCLLHIRGVSDRLGRGLRTLHLAEVLAGP